jgi:octaprenyl-diphosphate synthase
MTTLLTTAPCGATNRPLTAFGVTRQAFSWVTSEGEVFQLEQVFNPDITEENYFRILSCKTAYLIAACCQAAGFLAHSTKEQCDALGQYGQAIGMAFQLIDDALDYDGNLAEMGKNSLADLLEGKITMPIIALRDRMSREEKDWLKEAVANDELGEEVLHKVADLVRKYRTVEITISRAKAFTDEAVAALQVFPPSSARKHLELIATSLLSRIS